MKIHFPNIIVLSNGEIGTIKGGAFPDQIVLTTFVSAPSFEKQVRIISAFDLADTKEFEYADGADLPGQYAEIDGVEYLILGLFAGGIYLLSNLDSGNVIAAPRQNVTLIAPQYSYKGKPHNEQR